MLERAEHVARYQALHDGAVTFHRETKPGRPAGRGSETARALGISKPTLWRNNKVGSLSEEAKEVARAIGVDDNQDVLLRAAREGEPVDQVRILREDPTLASSQPPASPRRLKTWEERGLAWWDKGSEDERQGFLSKIGVGGPGDPMRAVAQREAEVASIDVAARGGAPGSLDRTDAREHPPTAVSYRFPDLQDFRKLAAGAPATGVERKRIAQIDSETPPVRLEQPNRRSTGGVPQHVGLDAKGNRTESTPVLVTLSERVTSELEPSTQSTNSDGVGVQTRSAKSQRTEHKYTHLQAVLLMVAEGLGSRAVIDPRYAWPAEVLVKEGRLVVDGDEYRFP